MSLLSGLVETICDLRGRLVGAHAIDSYMCAIRWLTPSPQRRSTRRWLLMQLEHTGATRRDERLTSYVLVVLQTHVRIKSCHIEQSHVISLQTEASRIFRE